jgi:hypothetical protein
VADFLGDGIVAGQPVLVIATTKHRDALTAELKARGFNVERLIRDGSLTMSDAQETLARFMLDGMPDTDRFHRFVTATLERVTRGRGDCVVRAYGEMVDVLWRAGQCDAAIRLEMLWNDLSKTHTFSLLCGYSMGHFYKHTVGFQAVCDQHVYSEILSTGHA